MNAVPPAYDAALRGDVRGLQPWLRTLHESEDPGERAWEPVARTLYWFASPEGSDALTVSAMKSAAAASPLALTEGLALLVRGAVLRIDAAALGAAEKALREVPGTRSALWADIAKGYAACLSGQGHVAVDRGEAVFREATSHGLASLVVEGTTLQAFGKMGEGDITAATALARRASRMAQVEHLWLTHYFTSVLLARLRRLGGRPHLAALIASACQEVTSAAFAPWLAWEQLFAGGEIASAQGQGPLIDATRALGSWFSSGDPGAWPERAATENAVATSALHRADLASVVAATPMDKGAPLGWFRGERHDPPPQLWGLSPPRWKAGALRVSPCVLGAPGETGRRVLGFLVPSRFHRLQPFGTRPARAEAIASALTLAGPEGIERSELFRQVYGFAYRKSVHERSFKVARHEAKRITESYAEIELRGETVYLTPLLPFAIVDPRCERPLQEVMLGWLAQPGGVTAKELAQHLRVSLRTIQVALREMTEDGVCQATREGRRTSYAVEDTTFCELTVA